MSTYKRSKNTKRFNFRVKRDDVSHKTGANSMTITYRDSDNTADSTPPRKGSYGFGGFDSSDSSVTMSIKEAKALQHFLNTTLS